MYRNSFFPLRTIVGNAIPLGKDSIRHVFESEESEKQKIDYQFSLSGTISGTSFDPRYAEYLPAFEVDRVMLRPGEGMDNLRFPPSPRPFADGAVIASFSALSKKKVAADVSRKLASRFTIKLPKKFLVGGICFGGLPYLPYSQNKIEASGENSANFGLPREIRITCANTTEDSKEAAGFDEFLDADISSTQQEIVSHSGFHYLCIDPTLTDTLTIHFSDYPTILKGVQFNSQSGEYAEYQHYGFFIPYFYVFEYQEKTRYRPSVAAGVLGAVTHRAQGGVQDVLNEASDFRYVVSNSTEGNYFDFTAASIFGQQRQYIVRDEMYTGEETKGEVKERFRECFISQKVEPNDKVVLYIEQGEEYERCIAGLKMFLPFIPDKSLREDTERIARQISEILPFVDLIAQLAANASRADLEKFLRENVLQIPKDIDFCESIGIKVYELDPVDGVSPLKVDLNGKYATLIAEKQIDELSEIALAFLLEGVRFIRPSNSKYFAIELTNCDAEAGQFVIKGLKLVQSAHVSVHPRAAKNQQIKTLNFRIISPNLAEDYALLGDEGFNFSIERLVAGEKINVLFQANSLMDLLHTGAAKIFSNVRRRAVEFEKTEYNRDINRAMNEEAENFERRSSRSEGWRQSETGEGVEAKSNWIGDYKRPPKQKFENYGTQEQRMHNESLFPDISLPQWSSAAIFANGMSVAYSGGNILNALLTGNTSNLLLPTYNVNSNNNTHQLVQGFGDYWKGINKNKLMVKGSISVNQSPYGISVTSAQILDDLFRLLDGVDDPMDAVAMLDMAGTLLGGVANVMPFTSGSALLIPTLNGLNFGLSLTAAGLGLAANPAPGTFLPSISQNASIGSQGSISNQASKTGYAYSQFLNENYDESDSRFESGEMKRLVTRKEVPNTDKQRVKGAEVMWQGEIADIISGAIPLNFTLPATASKMHFRTSDDTLRVRFGSGVGKSISVDFWFDLTEEIVKDDY